MDFKAPGGDQLSRLKETSRRGPNSIATDRKIGPVIEDFTIIFEPAEEGGFTAYIPELPGAVSEGETIDEAREMVLDAMREVLAYRREVALGGKSASAKVEKLPISA